MIELKDSLIVCQEKEEHFKIIINNKEIWVSKYSKCDEFGIEGDIEIFKGEELLSEEEKEEVINYIEDISK